MDRRPAAEERRKLTEPVKTYRCENADRRPAAEELRKLAEPVKTYRCENADRRPTAEERRKLTGPVNIHMWRARTTTEYNSTGRSVPTALPRP